MVRESMSPELHERASEMNERIVALRERGVEVSPEEAEIIVERHRRRRSVMSDAEAREQALLIEREVREAMIDLFRNQQPANQGNNGVIYKVSERNMKAIAADSMQEGGFLDKESAAAKVLKIYNPGAGVEEFRLQGVAFEALERFRAEHPTAPCALIPRAMQMRDFELDDETVAALNASGAHLHGNHAETLFMDFIPGKDFARVVYEEVLARTDSKILELYQKGPNESVEEYAHGNRSMEDLWLVVARILNLTNPETKTDAGVIAVDQVILFDNSRKIFEFLAATGYKVHPRLAEQLANTVAVMHALPVHHNDIHERNLMVVGDPQTEEAQLYLIDFGAARDKKSSMEDYRSDKSLIGILKKMQETKSDVQEREKSGELLKQAETIERHVRTPGAAMAYKRLLSLISAGNASLGEYLCGEGDLSNSYDRLAGLKLLVDASTITAAEADACIDAAIAYIAFKYEETNRRKRNLREYLPVHKSMFLKCRGIYSAAWQT